MSAGMTGRSCTPWGNVFAAAARLAALAFAIWSRKASEDFRGVEIGSSSGAAVTAVVLEALEKTELPSEEVLENVVDFFFLT